MIDLEGGMIGCMAWHGRWEGMDGEMAVKPTWTRWGVGHPRAFHFFDVGIRIVLRASVAVGRIGNCGSSKQMEKKVRVRERKG